MKISREEAQEQYGSPTKLADAPEYPYGLEVTLNDDALDTSGSRPDARRRRGDDASRRSVKVCRTNAYETLGGETEKSLSFQITDMAVEPQAKESKLYAGGEY
jgi:hypothetical protein